MGLRPPTRLRALVSPVFPHFCLVLPVNVGWSSWLANLWQGEAVFFAQHMWNVEDFSSDFKSTYRFCSNCISLHKYTFNEEKPVWHWNVCSGSGKVVNRRDGPQQGDRLDLEGMRSTPGKPQTGLFVYFCKLSSKTTNSKALGKTFYNNLFGKYPQLRNQFNMSGQMNNAQASQLD